VAGTITCRVRADAVDVTGHDVVFNGAIPATEYATIAKDEHTFTADQYITLVCIGSADLNPSTVDAIATFYYEY